MGKDPIRALVAVTRGYIGCIYAGSDSRDDTDGFLEVYPGYDWSRLTKRAWAMQQTYLAAKKVYKFLNAEDKLRIIWRYGCHETWATIIEYYESSEKCNFVIASRSLACHCEQGEAISVTSLGINSAISF